MCAFMAACRVLAGVCCVFEAYVFTRASICVFGEYARQGGIWGLHLCAQVGVSHWEGCNCARVGVCWGLWVQGLFSPPSPLIWVTFLQLRAVAETTGVPRLALAPLQTRGCPGHRLAPVFGQYRQWEQGRVGEPGSRARVPPPPLLDSSPPHSRSSSGKGWRRGAILGASP